MSVRDDVRPPRERASARLREVSTFLSVGASGYVVDVVVFNLLLSAPGPTSGPKVAKVLSVSAAMVVTYLGNRRWTWGGTSGRASAHQVLLFLLFNLAGMGFSVAALVVSHDLLGLTSRLADNLSANVVGLLMGTVFRYWAYRRFVFAVSPAPGAGPAPGRPPRRGARAAASRR